MTSRFVLRLATLLVALCVAVPATAMVARLTVYFSAGFNGSSAPGSGISVEVGSVDEFGPPGVFTVVGGQLRIADGGLATDAALRANLDELFTGTKVTIAFDVYCSQTTSGLTLRAEDDSDSGMIDVGFDGSGGLTVDGQDSGESYASKVRYHAELRLRDALVGDSTWHLLLKPDSGTTISLQGTMKSSAPMRMEDLQFIRAAGGTPGEFFIDNLKVTSNSYFPKY
ncbi:MAG: hypothetical protein ACYTCU_02805 [Planctomycetota bacterium]|jgi:hypothetical protein